MELALVARKDQSLNFIMFKVFFGELVIAVCGPKSGEIPLDDGSGGCIGISVCSYQVGKIGQRKPKSPAFVDVVLVVFQVEVFSFFKMSGDRVQRPLVVDGDSEKNNAFVILGKRFVFETMDESVIKELGNKDAELCRQRRLLLFGYESDAIDVDYVELAVFHRFGLLCYVERKLMPALQDDAFHKLTEHAFAAVFG